MLVFAAAIVAGGYGLLKYWPDHEENVPQKTVQEQSYRITALGDSLTEGVGDAKEGGYTGITERLLTEQKSVAKVTLDNFGHRGDMSQDLLNVLKRPEVRESIRESDMIFLTIGGNDLFSVLRKHFMNLTVSDFTAEQRVFTKNLNRIFTDIRKLNPSARIYYFGLYNPFEDYLDEANRDFVPILNRWNENSASTAEKFKSIVFIPTADIFKGKGDTLLYEDHFHPNRKGYHLFAKRLLHQVDKNESPGG
ncbi:GDSL family lipase [Sporolactobacillus sp. THM7-7]|nr:GDSL family lipase [Sporolactobacillus sp. THM7-7]